MRTIHHQFQQRDFYEPTWKVKYLFLGTFNPMGGKPVNYYYGRKSNQTWKILSKLFIEQFNVSDIDQLKRLLEKTGIACMDLIHTVRAPEERVDKILGKGYNDSKIINKSVIRDYNTDRILSIINANKDVKVYSTWGKGPSLKEWKAEVQRIDNKASIVQLVSPSMVAKVPVGNKKFDYMVADWNQKIKKR
ncbi:uracil-DNA glycosylase family protein [Spirosoma flavum]|uniref:Uncharacterized protein n=1 Tax=Spirosoma flavum TaxID=2048557 RepID=A0ABW6AQ06_9BACT